MYILYIVTIIDSRVTYRDRDTIYYSGEARLETRFFAPDPGLVLPIQRAVRMAVRRQPFSGFRGVTPTIRPTRRGLRLLARRT